MSDLAASLQAAAEAVRQGDPDRFAATMAAPADLRDRLWPLYAANLEIARAPWASSEPMVAEMRLQWWVDALEALSEGREPPHEIGPALVSVAQPARHLIAAAEARRADCWPDPFDDVSSLWAYLDQTSGALYWAAAEALGAPEEAEITVRSFGAGAGLAALLQAWPDLVARGRPPLVAPDIATLHQLAAEGQVRLEPARKLRLGAAKAALLPGWQARALLARARVIEDPLAPGALALSEFRRRSGLLRAALLGV
ncbi:squalene/phytoene synthase family protein [Thioclava electrotropha]|uniref:Squalene/phytoene synthase family protein n=1 Tax=Thioclava electrotropha TaxID=1549850 RepID=A0ABX6YUI0_9RHOB|nr:squalene/phytoene synthase family protein [Thioclava electrotropha]QPZ91172.1 squalene/phytoene synthase family protein [Thioclava electrotropha]